MVIGLPRERKVDEHRVALLPHHVSVLTGDGHRVLVEQGAGSTAGFSDAAYVAAGADVVVQDELYERASLVVKVKCPLPDEYGFLTDRHVLFAYLHFDECIAPARIQSIVDSGVTAIAYEWVEENGRYPLLEPMSALTGTLAALKTIELLMKHKGRVPVLSEPLLERPRAMVIGGGRIGLNAVSTLVRNGFAVTLVDKDPATIEHRYSRYISVSEWAGVMPLLTPVPFDEQDPDAGVRAIRQRLPETDIVICAAVRRPTMPPERCRYLIDRAALGLMAPNSVVCDATACDADLVETCLSTESLDATSTVDGIVHYCCDHLPAYIPHTASVMLSNVTFPYVRLLTRGAEHALALDEGLRGAVMCCSRHLTHARSAAKKGLPYRDLSDLLWQAAECVHGH